MCGIAGAIAKEGTIDYEGFKKMLELMVHRGPDDEGMFYSNIVALGNRRLSILDPTPNGKQPMARGDLVLVLNGEIYNYRELREELRQIGYSFNSDTDTEVLLTAILEWGLENALKKIIGMYAFLFYNKSKGILCGARDRFGIKPLLYARQGNAVYFASEIKAFKAIMELKPNARRIAQYLSFNRPKTNETFFEGVFSVPPASYFCTDGGDLGFKRYWYLNTQERDWRIQDAVTEWKRAFEDSVRLHLRTDVPLAFALSGGVDSSSLLAFTKKLLDEGLKERGFTEDSLKVFTVSVDDEDIDESKYAKDIAKSLGLEKNLEVIKVSSSNISMDELKKMIYYLEEPPEGPSSILHWLMMERVKKSSKDLKVLINGQGGDELLAGYHAYIPIYLREVIAKRGILRAMEEAWKLRSYIMDKFTLGLKVMLGFRKRVSTGILNDEVLSLIDSEQGEKIVSLNDALMKDLTGGRLLEILRTEDRSSMAFSIEIRVPYVNHVLAELSLSMPAELKIREGYTKWIHRKASAGMLPRDILWNRRKIGFQAPEKKWLFGLRDLFSSLMRDSYLVKIGILKKEAAKKLADDVIKGNVSGDYARLFWRILFAELWMRVYFGEADLSLPLYARLSKPN